MYQTTKTVIIILRSKPLDFIKFENHHSLTYLECGYLVKNTERCLNLFAFFQTTSQVKDFKFKYPVCGERSGTKTPGLRKCPKGWNSFFGFSV